MEYLHPKVVIETTGCKTIEAWPLDMADHCSIAAFVEKFNKEGGGCLDLLVLSAGVSTRTFEYSKEGWEST